MSFSHPSHDTAVSSRILLMIQHTELSAGATPAPAPPPQRSKAPAPPPPELRLEGAAPVSPSPPCPPPVEPQALSLSPPPSDRLAVRTNEGKNNQGTDGEEWSCTGGSSSAGVSSSSWSRLEKPKAAAPAMKGLSATE